MPAIIPAYLVYLAAAAIGGLVGCSSKDQESGPQPSGSTPTNPPEPQPILMIDKGSPDYKIYQALKDAGVPDSQMDRTSWVWSARKPEPKSSPWDPRGYVPPTQKGDGKISDVDLKKTAENLYSKGPQFKVIVEETFKKVADEYIPADFSQGDPSRFCQNDVPFQKAGFWNPDNLGVRFISGVCQSDRWDLFRVIKENPDFQPAKVALEKYYRDALKKDPKDPAYLYLNLGYALKIQGKYEEAISSYKKALALKPGLIEAQEEIRDVFLRQGKKAEALVQDKIVKKMVGKARPTAWAWTGPRHAGGDKPDPSDDGIDLRRAPKTKTEPDVKPLMDGPFEAPPPPEPKDKEVVKRDPGMPSPWDSPGF